MTQAIEIRDERPEDVEPIATVTREAFATLAISQGTEHAIIAALREAGALSLSLVARQGGAVVGHIAFSPITIADGAAGWYGLGPLSVTPALHRQGIGTALMEEGLRRLRALGARGCYVVGHPDYYRRFGFETNPALTLEGAPPEVCLAQSFDDAQPSGAVTFHPAFLAES